MKKKRNEVKMTYPWPPKSINGVKTECDRCSAWQDIVFCPKSPSRRRIKRHTKDQCIKILNERLEKLARDCKEHGDQLAYEAERQLFRLGIKV